LLSKIICTETKCSHTSLDKRCIDGGGGGGGGGDDDDYDTNNSTKNSCTGDIAYHMKIAQAVQRLATGWTIGVLGFDLRRGLGIFLFTTASRTALGPTQSPIQWVLGALSLGVKRLWREADHSPPSSAESRMCGVIHPLPPYAWCSVIKSTGTTLPLPLRFSIKFNQTLSKTSGADIQADIL
jgi:hypothetical protein